MASFLDRARERYNAKSEGIDMPLKAADEQTGEDKAIVSFVRSRLEDSRSASSRVALEGINLTNIAYLCGFDGVYYDGTSRQFKPIAQPNQYVRKNRVHVNRILPTVQNRLARLCKNPPRWDVRPKSGDEDDKDAARLSEQVLVQLWESTAINKKRIQLAMWFQQCGSAYLKATWDPTLGKRRAVPDGKDEFGVEKYKIITEGDIRVDVKSFFNIFPDPLAKNWEEVQYLHDCSIRPLEYFKEHYELGYLVKEEECWLNSLTYENRINSINTLTGSSGGANALKNSAIEISYYEKPSKRHPYGRHIITANGVKLKDDILPIDEIPYAKFDDILVGGKFNGEAIITHLRPLQDQLNRGKSMRAAWSNLMLTGKMIYARGHNLAREGGNDQSGEWLAYDPVPNAEKPGVLQMPAIPQYAYQDEDVLKSDINDTAGINEASRGQLPSSSIPAIGMQLLVEQDDTRIGIETESHEYSFADFGRILLKFVGGYYKTDRLLKIAGENMEYTVREFQGDDLNENFDVHVIRGSTIPGSKVLKRQEIINLHQQGYFGNPTDPLVTQNVLSMLEYGDEFQAWKRHSLRMAQIQRGLKLIEEQHKKPDVMEYDDHALWMQQLDDYRIGEKFQKLPEEAQVALLQCMAEHADYLSDMTIPEPAPDENPELKGTTAAQDAEAQAMGEMNAQPQMGMPEVPQPENPNPEGAM